VWVWVDGLRLFVVLRCTVRVRLLLEWKREEIPNGWLRT
jgi:hypothetical protein